MSRSTDNTLRLLKAGGNLKVSAEGKSTENLLRIVKLAAANQKLITVSNLEGKSTENVLRLIKAGGDYLIAEV
ncbi:hypothetical protein [uncultured Amphritea sp.]|uniref:hypothetical protein n=1 Tax=uncultured Amphritea sp. TaxID=981605 RepID=UPI002619633C|nr:hypothetical protein [uncultured Amphritea sp.]